MFTVYIKHRFEIQYNVIYLPATSIIIQYTSICGWIRFIVQMIIDKIPDQILGQKVN